MNKIAIVEDERQHADTLRDYLLRFAQERGAAFEIAVFGNAVSFLENYAGTYDIVFMDIRMPYMNGMDAAHRLRELDKTVILIFITSLTQYAVDGYEVNALNYIVKPVSYPDFALKFSKAYERLRAENNNRIALPTERGMIRLQPEEIAYCEVRGHQTIYHTARGDFTHYETLRSAEQKLADNGFCKCNHCYLVNLRYVQSLCGDEIAVCYGTRTDKLAVSRNKKKAFGEALKAYCQGKFSAGEKN